MATRMKLTKAHQSALRQLAKADGKDDHYVRAATGTALSTALKALKESPDKLATLTKIEPAHSIFSLHPPAQPEVVVEHGSAECRACEALFNFPFRLAAMIGQDGTKRIYSLRAPEPGRTIEAREGTPLWDVLQTLRKSPFKMAKFERDVPEYRTYRINDAGRAVMLEST